MIAEIAGATIIVEEVLAEVDLIIIEAVLTKIEISVAITMIMMKILMTKIVIKTTTTAVHQMEMISLKVRIPQQLLYQRARKANGCKFNKLCNKK